MLFFFFNTTATTQIYTLSLHDALPISVILTDVLRQELFVHFLDDRVEACVGVVDVQPRMRFTWTDRKSTRLNSSHTVISYAVFCLKKKKGQARQSLYRLMKQQRDPLTS